MAYALFKDGEKLSRTFPTEQKTLEKAEQAGLVEDPDAPVLEQGLKIQPCPADQESRNDEELDWLPHAR
jgi:hypothetical protein